MSQHSKLNLFNFRKSTTKCTKNGINKILMSQVIRKKKKEKLVFNFKDDFYVLTNLFQNYTLRFIFSHLQMYIRLQYFFF